MGFHDCIGAYDTAVDRLDTLARETDAGSTLVDGGVVLDCDWVEGVEARERRALTLPGGRPTGRGVLITGAAAGLGLRRTRKSDEIRV